MTDTKTVTLVHDIEGKPLGDTNLFKGIKVGEMDLKHRAVLAPLTRLRSKKDHIPNIEMASKYYDQRSKREGTFLISEAAIISPQAGGIDDAPGIWNDEQVEAWKPIIKKIHDNKSFIFIQFWALGRRAFPGILKRDGFKYVSASDDVYIDNTAQEIAIYANNRQHGLTIPEIKSFVQDFVNAAKKSIEAGADGVEIHSAFGFLLNQFLDPVSNKRTDEYGGSIENRCRFTLEVVDACIEAIGADRVGIRLSPWARYMNMSGSSDPTLLATYCYLIGELEKRARIGKRLAYVHLISNRTTDPYLTEGTGMDLSVNNNFARSIWKGNLILSGNFALHPEIVRDLVKDEKALIAYGRFWISNADLPYRLEKGLTLNKYDRDTFFGRDEKGYTDYPTYDQIKDLKSN